MMLDAADGTGAELALIFMVAITGPRMHDVIGWLVFR